MLKNLRKPRTYYDVLGVSPLSRNEVVRAAYTALTRENETANPAKHPTRAQVKRQRLLNEAFATLRTEAGRNRYNRLLLCAAGRPKGLALCADNDNARQATTPEPGLLGRLSGLLNRAIPSQKDQDHG